jgi:Peptidase family S41
VRGLAISIILSGVLASIQPAPALRNGGFEEAQAPAAPEGWRNASAPNAGYQVETIDDHPYEGRLAVRLKHDKAAPAKALGRLAQALDVAPLRGHRVRFSAAVRVIEGDRPPELSLLITGPDGKPAFANYSRSAPIVAHGWAVYAAEADVGAMATRLTVGLILPAGGAADMDAATFTDLGPLDPPPAAQVRLYLDSALGLLQSQHINGATADWPALRAKAYADTASASTPEQTYPAIRAVIRALGERHTVLMTPTTQKVIAARRATDPLPTGEVIGDIGVVRLVTLMQDPNDPKDNGTPYQQAVEAVIRKGDARNVCGWIIDLTGHSGGNMYPGIQGLGALLGEGSPGAFVSRAGKTPWSMVIRPSAVTVRRPDAPIAVILGPKTASAGEAIAIGLIGRPDTRTFGQPTAGFTTGNATFPLSDGARLLLTGSYEEDRLGRRYTGAITPDEAVALEEAEMAAKAWLATRGCGKSTI